MSSRAERTGRPRIGRRALIVGAAMGLTGCGFRPLYAPQADGAPSPVADELAAIHVDIIPDRPGQELREALQERFERFGIDPTKRYSLSVSYGIGGDGIAILPDNSSSYLRYIATAAWTLRSLEPPAQTVTTGSTRAVDSLNVLDQQYFAMDLETEAIQRRLAGEVADQISLQLASFFAKRHFRRTRT